MLLACFATVPGIGASERCYSSKKANGRKIRTHARRFLVSIEKTLRPSTKSFKKHQ
jgi:hypothetical protein